jgi:hypothetical protein
MAHVVWFVFIYACVNALAVVRNTVEIVHLRQKFQSEYDVISAEIEHTDDD